MNATYRSFGARWDRNASDRGKIAVTAWPIENDADPLGILGGERVDFGKHQDEEAIAWLTGKGCDPVHAQFLVLIACRGKHGVEVFPGEGRVDVTDIDGVTSEAEYAGEYQF